LCPCIERFSAFRRCGTRTTAFFSAKAQWDGSGCPLSRLSPFTVNGPVKFAIEGRKLFVLDDDGKEHEMEIIERILRLPAEQAKPQH
jgi:hypothetical protein